MVILFQRTSLDNPNRVRQRKKDVKPRNELRAPGGAFPCKAVAEAVQVLNAFMRECDTLLLVSPVEYEALGFTEYEALGPAECEAPGPGASAEQLGLFACYCQYVCSIPHTREALKYFLLNLSMTARRHSLVSLVCLLKTSISFVRACIWALRMT